MRLKFIYFFTAVLGQESDYTPKKIEHDVWKNIKKRTNSFGWDLLFSAGDSNENKVISPLSVIGAMYMLAAGSGGKTQKEILDKLTGMENYKTKNYEPKALFNGYYNLRYFLTNSRNTYNLQIANTIFANEGLLDKQFKKVMRKYMFNDVENIQTVDFFNNPENATEVINEWIRNATNGMIDPMYSETIDSQMAILIASTLWFKSSWKDKFDLITEDTDEKVRSAACWPTDFSNTGECDETVQFMQSEQDFPLVTLTQTDGNLKMDVIEIPMEDNEQNFEWLGEKYRNKMVFQIWLPQHDIRNEVLDEQYQKFIRNKAPVLKRNGQFNLKRKVRLTMPKFSIEFGQDVKELMEMAGISTLFGPEKDLTPMVGEKNNDVEISGINHKVKFDVDENGIEGAAVTAVEISFRTISRPKPISITRPFYFTVSSQCWNTGSTRNEHKGCPYGNVPLFIGKVVRPSI